MVRCLDFDRVPRRSNTVAGPISGNLDDTSLEEEEGREKRMEGAAVAHALNMASTMQKRTMGPIVKEIKTRNCI